MVFGILSSLTKIKPVSPAVEAWMASTGPLGKSIWFALVITNVLNSLLFTQFICQLSHFVLSTMLKCWCDKTLYSLLEWINSGSYKSSGSRGAGRAVKQFMSSGLGPCSFQQAMCSVLSPGSIWVWVQKHLLYTTIGVKILGFTTRVVYSHI